MTEMKRQRPPIQPIHEVPNTISPTKPPFSALQEEVALQAFSSGAFLSVNKTLLRHYGPEPALILSNWIDKQIYFKARFPKNDGWFFLTHEQQREQLGVTDHAIRKVKKLLRKDGILETKQMGIPAKEWYKINIWALVTLLGQDLMDSLGQGNMNPLGQEDMNSLGLIKENKNKENKNKENKEKDKDLKNSPKELILENLPQEWKDNDKFISTLEDYVLHRKEIRQSITPLSGRRLANKFIKYSPQVVIKAIEQSIENGWTGVFPEDDNGNNGNGKKPPHRGAAPIPGKYIDYDTILGEENEN